MNQPAGITRRDSLKYLSAVALCGAAQGTAAEPAIKPKSVAAVVTAYRKGLHADVLIGKILEGWQQDGGDGPALTLASMYVEQTEDHVSGDEVYKDMAHTMAKKYDFPIFDTIEKAVTVGGNQIPVDGVISIGEHGKYPANKKGQHLYPRRRFLKRSPTLSRKTIVLFPCSMTNISDRFGRMQNGCTIALAS